MTYTFSGMHVPVTNTCTIICMYAIIIGDYHVNTAAYIHNVIVAATQENIPQVIITACLLGHSYLIFRQ